LVIRFIELLQNLDTNNYDSLTELHIPKLACNHSTNKVISVCCLHQSLPDDGSQQCPLLPCSVFLTAGHCLATNSLLQQSTLSSVKLSLVFISTVIPVLSLFEIKYQDFHSLLEMYVAYKHLVTARTENTVPLLMFPIVALQIFVFVKPLHINDCCTFAHLVVVA
jgi:hypothetical protein